MKKRIGTSLLATFALLELAHRVGAAPPATVEGGNVPWCIAYGALAGLSAVAGNVWGFIGFTLAGIRAGCL